MPDLDFTGLAEEARQAFKPRFDEVVRRTRRRRWWLAGLATVAVTLASGGVAVGLAGGTASTPDETQVTRRVALTPVAVGDAARFYQLVQSCDTVVCHDRFGVSSDRGARWTLRDAPGPADASREILLAVNLTVVVAARQGSETTHWVTTDGGQTWRPATAEDRELGVNDRIMFVDGSRVVSVAAGTGRVGVAPGEAPLKEARPFEAGSAWGLVGFTGNRTGLSIAWSVPGARPWEVLPLPRDDGFMDVTTANGTDVYALYQGEGGIQVYASRDGGRTWTPGAVVPDPHGSGPMLATRTGLLWLATTTAVLSSTDGGRTFQPHPRFVAAGALTFDVATDLYVASTKGVNPRVWVSEDGRTWAETPS
ncbi:WD40/YVTN/BNR-like repeat-containing protein [Asanoa iriomotensis]|uniref:BNR/Asp-box repeat protein n=1 Tax=Asanoa iriomotensis TaxID=234613 RepID=A0ABQ4C9U9_9ACTN|nr:sialidase family protein [Asanoa iriomotensis]GIF59519.1 hypothetical protein Air01nite_56140 [Asanoa iriomotensis]